MEILNEDFIFSRINKATDILKQNDKDYQDKGQEYDKLLKDFIFSLTTAQVENFDKLMDILGSQNGMELKAVYQLAFRDYSNIINGGTI